MIFGRDPNFLVELEGKRGSRLVSFEIPRGSVDRLRLELRDAGDVGICYYFSGPGWTRARVEAKMGNEEVAFRRRLTTVEIGDELRF